MTYRLHCPDCRGVWVSAAAHGMAQDLERCPRCGAPLTLEQPPRPSGEHHSAEPHPPGCSCR